MKYIKCISVLAMSVLCAAVVSAVETGTGTNQTANLYATNSINLQGSIITSWQGLTNDSLLGGTFDRRDTGVTNIAANAVTNSQIANGAVTTDKIADDAVTEAKIANNAVTNAQIATAAVTTDKIADDAVTTAKIADNAVTNAQIAANAVTSNKIDWTTMPASDPSQWAAYHAVSNINMAGFSITNSTQVTRWDNGIIMREGGGGTLAYSNLYYYNAGIWTPANATNSTTANGMLGLALGESVTNDGLLLNGYCTNAWGAAFTPGSIIYMDTNNGALALARPTGTNNIVRIVGYVVSDSKIFFNPDRTFIEIVGD